MGSKKYRNRVKRENHATHHDIAANTFWDDAKELYEKSLSAIEQTHGELAHFLKSLVSDPSKVELISDKTGLIGNINLLNRDIGEHTARLNAIFATHSTRTGGTVTPDEHMAVIQIHGQYHDALEIYDSTIMPTVTHIFEQIGAIEDLLNAQQTSEPEAIDVPDEELADEIIEVTQKEKTDHV